MVNDITEFAGTSDNRRTRATALFNGLKILFETFVSPKDGKCGFDQSQTQKRIGTFDQTSAAMFISGRMFGGDEAGIMSQMPGFSKTMDVINLSEDGKQMDFAVFKTRDCAQITDSFEIMGLLLDKLLKGCNFLVQLLKI